MATFASLLSSSLHPLLFNRSNCSQTLISSSSSSSSSLSFPYSPISSKNPRKPTPSLILASSNSSSNFNDCFSNPTSGYYDKKSVLSDLIQEIEPLDVSLIQRDVPPTTVDAMKRTISGMLGLLPSDRFKVFIEALWEPLSKLLVSSMMTGYTLRNAEYRLCLERSLDDHEGDMERRISQNPKLDSQLEELDSERKTQGPNAKNESSTQDPCDDIGMEGLGEISSEAQQYILHLQSRLSFVKKELHEVKRKRDALQMQQFVGEEKNDLLDYLRSLKPEMVAELSEPTCPELKEVIHSTVHGLLATLSPKIHSKAPSQSENMTSTTLNVGSEDCAELVENTSLNFQPLISLTRDYLARLLFWCMLLGHYLRGLENRMELTELLSLTRNLENDDHGAE